MVAVLDDAPVEDNVFRPAEAGAVGEGLMGLGLEGGKGGLERGWVTGPSGLSPRRSMVHATSSPCSSPVGWDVDWGAGRPAEISAASKQCPVRMRRLPKNDAGKRPSGATWRWCKPSVNTAPLLLHLFIHPSRALSRIWLILKIFLSASFSSCFGGFYDFKQIAFYPTVFQVSVLAPHIHTS